MAVWEVKTGFDLAISLGPAKFSTGPRQEHMLLLLGSIHREPGLDVPGKAVKEVRSRRPPA